MGKPLPEAISVRMAAEILGVAPITIRRWIWGDYIKAYRVGPRLIRIPRDEVARLRTRRANDPEGDFRFRSPIHNA